MDPSYAFDTREELCGQDTASIHGVFSSHVHMELTICTMGILNHIRLLALGVEGRLASPIELLNMYLHTCHGEHECVYDPDTANIRTISSYHTPMGLIIWDICILGHIMPL